MCRNIRPLFNFDPPATQDEIRAAALQFVRKVSGFTQPSKANEQAFNTAVDAITGISADLLGKMQSTGKVKNREQEAVRARERSARRFGNAGEKSTSG